MAFEQHMTRKILNQINLSVEDEEKQLKNNTANKSWSKWKNKDFKEKFCHFSGEVSNGETSSSRPVLAKNYAAAMRLQKELYQL